MTKKKNQKSQSEKIADSVRERRTMELRFRESEQYYRELLEHLPVGVYRTTPSGNIIEANHMLADILGYDSPEDLRDVDVNSLYVQRSDREDHLRKLDASLTHFTVFELRRRDGRIIWVRDFPHAVMAPDGSVAHYTGVLLDVTEQRETQRQLHKALVELENSNRERQAVIAKLEDLSLLDDLTKLYNRRGFMAEAQQTLQKAQKAGRRVFFLFMDLDNLKWINDSWGHQKGDQALIQFADILRKALRGTDIKGRLGGDEFAVLALETEDFSPEVLSERLQERVEEFNSGEHYPFSLSISMGISYFDPHYPSSIDELLVRADKLMYEQKRSKHNS